MVNEPKKSAQRILDEISAKPEKKTEFRIPKLNWKITSIVLGILLIVSLGVNTSITGFSVGKMSSSDAAEKVSDFVEQNVAGVTVEITGKSIENNLHKIDIIMSGAQGAQPLTLYATLDGSILFPSAVPLDEIQQQTQTTGAVTAAEYSEADKAKIADFVNCLEEKNFKIYGANWCGWTKKLVVDTFGGFDVVEPIYVECTEEEDTCSQEEIKGYPTIKIDGEQYSGARTFEAFETETGCTAPNIQQVQTSQTDAVC